MKENDKLDKWLVDSVGNYQPSVTQSSKDRFLSQAAELTAEAASGSNAHKSNGRSYIIISLLLLIAVSGFILWQSEDLTSSSIQKSTSAISFDSTNKSDNLNQDIHSNKSAIAQSENSKLNQGITVKPSQFGSQSIDVQSFDVQTTDESSFINTDQLYSSSQDELLSIAENTRITEISIAKTSIAETSIAETSIAETIVDTSSRTQTIDDPEKKNKPVSRLFNQSLFVYYRPEVIWNVIGNEKDVHNLGIEWNTRLFNGNYLIGTGLGVTLTKGYYEYAIEYNEYLGDYTRLDSISFNWVPDRFAMEQTMHTSSEEVFDTAVTTDKARVDRKFVYLQIPLNLGYDILKTSNTTLGFRFAPVLSVLMSKKPVDFRYETGKNKLVQINRITPDRVKTNWQLNAGICYGRRLSENLWLEFEPRFSYYFNSVYEKSDNSSSPMGASIRVAVGIKY